MHRDFQHRERVPCVLVCSIQHPMFRPAYFPHWRQSSTCWFSARAWRVKRHAQHGMQASCNWLTRLHRTWFFVVVVPALCDCSGRWGALRGWRVGRFSWWTWGPLLASRMGFCRRTLLDLCVRRRCGAARLCVSSWHIRGRIRTPTDYCGGLRGKRRKTRWRAMRLDLDRAQLTTTPTTKTPIATTAQERSEGILVRATLVCWWLEGV